MFVGMGGTESLTDPTPATSTLPPYVIVNQGTPGGGPSGATSAPPPIPGWDTLAAGSDDVLPNGQKLGPITEIIVAAKFNIGAILDNVRIFVSSAGNGGGPTPPVASDDLYVLPANTTPGTSFTSTQIAVASVSSASVLDNDTSGSTSGLTAQLVSRPKHDSSFQLNPDGTFTYVPDSTYNATDQSTDSFTYVATDGIDTSSPATVTIVTTGGTEDSDGDGVPDSVEALVPGGGDGNKDGTPDYLEPSVASLLGIDGQYWTITTSKGTLAGVHDSTLNSSLPAAPGGDNLAAGIFSFQVVGLSPGATDVVAITADSSAISPTFLNGFDELNPTNPGWTHFALGATTAPAVQISASRVSLTLEDGKGGDLDGKGDGTITVDGGPAFVTTGSPQDTDGDGVPDYEEVAASGGGDGNSDGALDYLEPKVASLTDASGVGWTLVTGLGRFADVANSSTLTSYPALPPSIDLIAGLFSFQVRGLQSGLAERDVVSIASASIGSVNAFYLFNPSTSAWTNFALDSDGIGADTQSGTGQSITLNLEDGARGDNDGHVDGTISVLGGPAVVTGTPFAPDIHFAVPHLTTGTITIASNVTALNGAQVQLLLMPGPSGGAQFGNVSIDQSTGSFIYTSSFTPANFDTGLPINAFAQLIHSDSFSY